ncbi:hypothetical protein [Microlunatus sp. GCM10028923]|uniref:hypothetical protein n=1 Tax=Microlunatus sp. GCM10028923 TaxID=3273400 RepID=UPI00361E2803
MAGSSKTVGAALLAGVALCGVLGTSALAATTGPAAGTVPADRCSAGAPYHSRGPLGTPTATANTEVTEAFRTFGNNGGGWPNQGGWAASDGVYSTTVPGKGVVWLMNDTFLGPVNQDESMTEPGFIHGSILLGGADGLPDTTITGGTRDEPKSIADPPGAVDGDPWYWNGDGIMDGGKLRVFEYRIGKTDGEPPWNFGWISTDIVTYTEDFKVERVTTSYGEAGGVSWGTELVQCGRHTYIYGLKDNTIHLARARAGGLTGNDWEFWNGSGWSSDPHSTVAITTDVGASYSITPMGGEFVLTTTSAAIFTDHRVYVATAPTPIGPWSPKTPVYTAPEGGVGNLYAPYNVAAHPGLSKPGELVISYNVNSQQGDDLLANANNNRPRFVTIRF